MSQGPFQYHIVIIRLWPEAPSQSPPHWRLTLESPASNARRGFTDLRALLDEVEVELMRLMDEAVSTQQDPAESSSC